MKRNAWAPALAILVFFVAAQRNPAGGNGPVAGGEIPELFAAAAPPANVRPLAGRIVLRRRFVRVRFGALAGPEGPPSPSDTENRVLRLNLFEDVSFTAVLERIEKRSEESFTWIGRIQGEKGGSVTLAVENGVMAGNIRVGRALYQVRYRGAGVHAVYQIDPGAFPPESEPLRPSKPVR